MLALAALARSGGFVDTILAASLVGTVLGKAFITLLLLFAVIAG